MAKVELRATTRPRIQIGPGAAPRQLKAVQNVSVSQHGMRVLLSLFDAYFPW
jgi:hypothetical protein